MRKGLAMKLIYRDKLFFLMCFCIPFLFVPKMLQLNVLRGPIGSELIVLPIIIFYIFTVFHYEKRNMRLANVRQAKFFFLAYVLFLLISFIHGLYVYPYYDLVFSGPLDQIEKLPRVLAVLQSFYIMIDQITLLKIWFLVRFFKGIFLEIIYTFGLSYLLYCWYKKDPQIAVQIIQKTSYIIVFCMTIYSFFEISYLFGYDWGANVLEIINPCLHAIQVNFDWWPPMFWPGRVRSLFPEPSQLGMYAAFIMPFIWIDILNHHKYKMRLLMVAIISLLVFLSLSKTANGLLLGELGLLIVYILFRRDLNLLKRYIMIMVIVGFSFGASLWCISNYYTQPFNINFFANKEKNDAMVTAQQYVDKNLNSVVNENSGSNGARFAIMKSDIRIWKDHFFLGVGNGLKSAYTMDYLTTEEQQVPEVIMWGHLQLKEGVLKSGYPSINEFSKRIAENGIIGLLLYVFPMMYLFFILIKKKRYCQFTKHGQNTLVCILISLITSFIAGFSGTLTTFESYWIVLGVVFAYITQNKIQCNVVL